MMIFSCFTLNLCALLPLCAADDEPYEALFKTVGGEEIGGYKIEKFGECCQGKLPAKDWKLSCTLGAWRQNNGA